MHARKAHGDIATGRMSAACQDGSLHELVLQRIKELYSVYVCQNDSESLNVHFMYVRVPEMAHIFLGEVECWLHACMSENGKYIVCLNGSLHCGGASVQN